MLNQYVIRVYAFILLLGGPLIAHAQEVIIPAQTLAEQQAQNIAVRGKSMAAIRKQFGAPVSKKPAVGNPPITQWVYNDAIIYFESGVALHRVVIKK